MEKKFGRGDIVWLDFSPTHGHEQKGKRPALVLSPEKYNVRSKLMLVCPITSQQKGHPFEVPIQAKVSGVVLADQIRSIDWTARKVTKTGVAPKHTLQEVARLISLILPEH